MGFFSKIWKGIKSAGKSIVKGVKKVFKATKKIWDKFRKSTIGKVIMVAAAVYFGGVALGAWGGSGTAAAATATSTLGAAAPTAGAFSSAALGIEGVAGSTAAMMAPQGLLAAAAPTAGLAAPAGASLLAAAPTAAATTTATSGIAAAMPTAAELFGAAPAATSLAAPGTALASTVAPPVEPTTFLGSETLGSGVEWMEANPVATQALGQGISAMAAPSAEDQYQAQYDMWVKQQEYDRARQNVAGINADGTGEAIGMGLIERASGDLNSPTYTPRTGT